MPKTTKHLRVERFKLDTSQIDMMCFVSTVAKQMMSNTIVAIYDIVQMCYVGFSIQIELICCGWICSIIYSLPGHSAFTDGFCHPSQRTQA